MLRSSLNPGGLEIIPPWLMGHVQARPSHRERAGLSGLRSTPSGAVCFPQRFGEVNVIAKYPIAVVVGAPHQGLARQWVALALSDKGQSILRRSGFKAPSIAEGAR